jgi:renalase
MAVLKNLPVAIVGAGLAGLSCATELQRAGLKVIVFDKSRGVGGRMSTRRGDNWSCDHGAQYFTARDVNFRAEVERWRAAGVANVWQPRLAVWDGAWSPVRDIDIDVERFVGVPRMTAPARLLADGLTVQLSTTIERLEQLADGWHLFSVEHGLLPDRFAAVLLAIPAPQVLPLLENSTSELAQHDLAPELAVLARTATMHGCWALMLQYDTPLALPFDAAFINRGPLRWLARDNSKPGRGARETWLLHANAAWSDAHLESNAEDIAAQLLAAFAELGAPQPAAWTAHRWRFANTEQAPANGCAWHAALGLGLCGDWLNGGKVEGAWLSGRELARRVLQTAQ